MVNVNVRVAMSSRMMKDAYQVQYRLKFTLQIKQI